MEQEIEKENHLLFLQKEEELQLVRISEMDTLPEIDTIHSIYFLDETLTVLFSIFDCMESVGEEVRSSSIVARGGRVRVDYNVNIHTSIPSLLYLT